MDLPGLLPRSWSLCFRWLLGYVHLPSSIFFSLLHQTAEIYYFKPVSSVIITTLSTGSRSHISSFPANCLGIFDVSCHHLLHSRICNGNIHTPPWFVPLLESRELQLLPHSVHLIPFQHPFNKKENAFIIIMASAASHSALATEVLAVQRLYYSITPNTATSIFLLFSSQLLGYGIGGVLRREFVLIL